MEELLQYISETKVSWYNEWVWGVFYAIGLLTWGYHGTIKITKKFNPSKNSIDNFYDIIGTSIIWLPSPVWVPLNIMRKTFLFIFKKAFLWDNKDREGTDSKKFYEI